ncbi:MAG: ATP-binding cassette domain-containing protein [Hyphomicrobiaceae bacterium]|nr:ATP-binding cassette domain-containing protein [Hyphomicrobiaceae bacterium]
MLDATARYEGGDVAGTQAREEPAVLPCEVRGLCFEAGGDLIIDNVDLTLGSTGITVVMGPNGAGKSILVRLLHGMLEPSAGDISWGGRGLCEETRRRQAMVFQTPVLLRRSVEANIAFALRLHGENGQVRCVRILDEAGLAEKAGQPARLLSGGERQRLAIARALAADPEVLFLDEATASLDPASVQAIEEVVQSARDRSVKIIFITHDIGQARRLADDVVFMHRGRIVERAPAGKFFDNPSSREASDYLAGRIVL